MMTLKKGDIVEFSNPFQTMRCTVDCILPNNMVRVIRPAGTPLTIAAASLTLIEAAAPVTETIKPVATTPKVPRYECLECGHLHSQRTCPACSGSDKIDYVAPISADRQAQIAATQARQKELNALAYAASHQPSVQRDAIPADAVKFTVEQNSYTQSYFLLSSDVIIYVEIEGGYPSITRVEDADLAQQIRQATKKEA